MAFFDTSEYGLLKNRLVLNIICQILLLSSKVKFKTGCIQWRWIVGKVGMHMLPGAH